MNFMRQSGISLIEIAISLLLISISISAYLNFYVNNHRWQQESQQTYRLQLEQQNA